MALLIENADHEVTKAYVSTKGEVQDKEYMEALEAMADMLNNYHAMMGFELTGGF